MERLTKTLVLAAVILLVGCNATVPKLVEPPKPTVDVRILQLCETRLTPVSAEPPPEELFISYGEAIDLLNSCACRQREARNALCQISAPGCDRVEPCKKVEPNDTLKK